MPSPNYQHHHCLLNRLFRRISKKTLKFRVTGLCAGNSPVTGEFPTQRASNAENASIWWRHHVGCSACNDFWHYAGYIQNICVLDWSSLISICLDCWWKFGEKYVYPCHCRNNEVCDRSNGSCPSGCDDGYRDNKDNSWHAGAWTGFGCQIGTYKYNNSISNRHRSEAK